MGSATQCRMRINDITRKNVKYLKPKSLDIFFPFSFVKIYLFPDIVLTDELVVDAFSRFTDLPPSGEWLNMPLVRSSVSVSTDCYIPEIDVSGWPSPPIHVDVCIFHAPCFDGTAAAFAVGKKYGKDCSFFGVNRGSGDTDVYLPNHIDGVHVVLVDYVYSRPLMEELISRAATVTVVDHHDSERDLLNEFLCKFETKFFLIFSTACSASMLAYRWLFPDESVPQIYHYINDNDTGSRSLVNVGKFISGFSIYSPVIRPGWSEFSDFDFFCECVSGGPDFIRSRIMVGIIAREIEWRDVYADAQRCTDKRLKVAPQHICRILNIGRSANSGALSRALLSGEYLADGFSAGPADISFLYYRIDVNGSWKVSLRSDTVNVGEIAGLLGGGGHTAAGSFTYYGGDILELFDPSLASKIDALRSLGHASNEKLLIGLTESWEPVLYKCVSKGRFLCSLRATFDRPWETDNIWPLYEGDERGRFFWKGTDGNFNPIEGEGDSTEVFSENRLVCASTFR